MLICLDQRTGIGCGAENRDGAQFCGGCGKSLRFALQLRNTGDVVNGRYRIVRVIGHGGFGAVYEAEDAQQPGQHVALKETFDPAEIQHYRAEFAVLSALAHPHLPRYFEVFEANGNGYLVMEYVPGQSLEEIFRAQKGPLVESLVLSYAGQICEALTHLHAQKPAIIHRDIKPANIRLTPTGLIKLVDFGLVKQGTGPTQTLRGLGTPEYAPPEQWGMNGQHTDPRSDIYALGATLYHLLTAQSPAPGLDRLLAVQAGRPDPLPPPQTYIATLSQPVANALTAALAVRPDQRPATAADLRKLLQGAAQSQPAASAPAVPSKPAQPTAFAPQAQPTGLPPSDYFALYRLASSDMGLPETEAKKWAFAQAGQGSNIDDLKQRYSRLYNFAYGPSHMDMSQNDARNWAVAHVMDTTTNWDEVSRRYSELRLYAYAPSGLDLNGTESHKLAMAYMVDSTIDAAELGRRYADFFAFAFNPGGLDMTGSDARRWALERMLEKGMTAHEIVNRYYTLLGFASGPTGLNKAVPDAQKWALTHAIDQTIDVNSLLQRFNMLFAQATSNNMTDTQARIWAAAQL